MHIFLIWIRYQNGKSHRWVRNIHTLICATNLKSTVKCKLFFESCRNGYDWKVSDIFFLLKIYILFDTIIKKQERGEMLCFAQNADIMQGQLSSVQSVEILWIHSQYRKHLYRTNQLYRRYRVSRLYSDSSYHTACICHTRCKAMHKPARQRTSWRYISHC